MHLGAGNRARLTRLYGSLLRFVAGGGCGGGGRLDGPAVAGAVVPHLFAMTHESPGATAEVWVGVLSTLQAALAERLGGAAAEAPRPWFTSGELLLLQLGPRLRLSQLMDVCRDMKTVRTATNLCL